MKLYFSSALLLASVAIFLNACNDSARVAADVEGSWTGNVERFNKKVVADGSYTPVYTFERTDKTSGNITMNAAVSVTMPINAPIDSMGTTPVSATAVGEAQVKGIWSADDDDVDVTFDPSSLSITMDPNVQFEYANVWTTGDKPVEQTVPAAVMKAFQEQMEAGMKDLISRFHEFDDIKVKNTTLMQCEILDHKTTLSKVLEPAKK